MCCTCLQVVYICILHEGAPGSLNPTKRTERYLARFDALSIGPTSELGRFRFGTGLCSPFFPIALSTRIMTPPNHPSS
jgi:hypothetical protein